jgi:Chitobiase/beta-hexosaminidase C-terminal domain
VKLRAALLALVIAIAVFVGESQATVTAVGLTLSESSTSAVVSGSTLYYAPSSTGSFTVTATASSSASITSVDFPLITGMTGGGSVASPGPYLDSYDWTSSTVTSGLQTVTAYDGDPSNKTAQFTVKPDTVPTVSNVASTENSGAGDQFWSSSANTLWFRPAGAGSFTLKATAASSGSGITQVAFPDISGTAGWTGSTGGADTSSSYASPVAYTWTAGAGVPGAKQVTATTATGVTGSSTITIAADTTAPTGQTVALSGGPWYASLSVPLTLGAGTDVGAGIDASRGIVQRASATLANGACGTFGTFAAVTLSSGADTGVASGNCYRYQYQVTDNVGNVSTASAATSTDAKIDTTPPAAPTLLLAGFVGSAASGNAVYYRPTGSGRFTVTAASADGESGIASYTFPSAAGFTVSGSGTSRTYSFSSAPAAPPAGLTVTATNSAGLTSPAASFTLVPDPTPPTVTIHCNGGSCLSTPYPKAVTVSLAAADAGGSGVDTIRYSTNGTDPTPDRGVEYTGPFIVNSLTLLKVRAYDKAGNWSSPLAVTVRSLADKLVLSAPLRLAVKSGARYLFAKVTTTRRAMASATMTGPNLKQPKRWRFILGAGTSIVQLKLPAGLARTGRYKVVWRVQAGTQKTTRTTMVTLR